MSKFAAVKLFVTFSSFLVLLVLVGCGAGSSVSGTVTAEGKPVTGGSVTLAPIAAAGSEAEGGPVAAPVNEDGTFKIQEGTVAGKHRVMYSPPFVESPAWDGYGTPPKAPKVPYSGMAAKEPEVDIKSGSNSLTIELVPNK